MTDFWLIAALMMLVSLAFIVLPLSRPRVGPPVSELQASLAIHRERLHELDLARAQGTASDAELHDARDDIARQILADAAPRGSGNGTFESTSSADRNALLGAALVIPAVAVLLYFQLGDVGALNEIAASRPVPASAQRGGGAEHSVADRVQRLEARLRAEPRDAEGWTLLGRSYGYLKEHDKAAGALTRAMALDPENTALMTDLAEALVLANGHRVDARAKVLLDKVLSLEPEHPKARFLSGLTQAAAPVRAAAPSAVPAAVAAGASGPSGGLTVRVTLARSLQASLPAGAVVFVFARPAQGPRMPLAIVRRPASELPFEVQLGDAQAMSPQHKLSQYARVIVGARVSATGNAMPAAGDLEGLGAPLEWARAVTTQVEIDHVVQ